MASNNIIGACIEYHDGFGYATKPDTIWFDGVPVKDGDGVPISLPTVEILHLGCVPSYTLEGVAFDQHTLRFVVRAVTLAAAAAIAKGLKYDTGTPMQFGGFDGAGEDNSGTAFPLATGQKLKAMIRQREQFAREAARDPSAAPVHRIEITYIADVTVTA